MRVIFKYKIETEAYTELQLPLGAKILDVAFQGDKLYAWALINNQMPSKQTYGILTVPTGVEFEALGWEFVKTVHAVVGGGSNYVLHIFHRR